MHCRFVLVFFLPLYAELSLANSGAWNCEKVEGKEWACNAQPSPDQPETSNIPPLAGPNTETVINLPEPLPFKPAPVYIKPPKTVAKRQGWTCASAEDAESEGSWSCSLIGTDPKGQAKEVNQSEYSSGILTAAFDFNQEQIFETLHSQLKYDPWENCSSTTRGSDNAQYISEKDLRDASPMDVRADYSEVFDKEITSFFGNVEIIRADQHIMSDMASYNTVSDTMDAQGHVLYSEDELALYSDTALLNLGTDEARLREALFISPSGPIRGSAGVVYRDSKILSRYKDVAFTSCRPGNQDWVIHADRLKMNKGTGKASAKHAWLEFKGLPVLYTPYISFPLDDRRLSGFLPASFGANDKNGIDIVAPYYFNLAPNYDLTIWPRFMSKRGGMLGGDFRYLTKMTKGSVGFELLPYDILEEKARYSATFKNKTSFMPNLNSDIDINYVSDKEYFDDLNNALGISNDRHLRSTANINYHTEGLSFSTQLETYQTLDKNIDDIDKPYQKLPEVTLKLDHSFDDWPIELEAESQYVNFYRGGRVSGHRININPSISMPLESAGAFFKPRVSLQHTQYFLTDLEGGKSSEGDEPSIKLPVFEKDNPSRTLPIFSVDSGLIFERDFKFNQSAMMHTIEPRLFYLYIPKEDQEDIPVFDSSEFDFNFSSLFRENRFSGKDRVQDANQITVAMTTRLIDSDSGQERLNFSIGEIFYLQDREVFIPGEKVEKDQFSNVVAELRGRISDQLSFSSGMQWNPGGNEFTRAQFELKYRDQSEKIINLGFRYRRDVDDTLRIVDDTPISSDSADPEAPSNSGDKDKSRDITSADIVQLDASFKWPLYNNWFGVGRMQYSFKYDSIKESFLGLEKESCCWRFRVVWRRYTDTLGEVDDPELDEGIFVQIELKGLTSFGDKVDEFLEKNIKGYQRTE